MSDPRETLKRRLKKYQYHYCSYCEDIYLSKDMNIEHIIPKSWGGRSNKLNLMLACKTCNTELGKVARNLGLKLLKQDKVFFFKKKKAALYLNENYIDLLFQEYLLFKFIKLEQLCGQNKMQLID